jgi:hypothetical protein
MLAKITALAVLSVLFTLGGSAYAETATVEVPFTSHGSTCSFDEIAVEFHCVWQGMIPEPTFESMQEIRDLISAERYQQEIDRLNEEALTEIAEEKAKLTPNEKTIQKIEQKLAMGIATATESVYMNLLKELNTCKQGMDRQTAPFQEAREFEISEFNLWQVNNVPVEGHLGELVMAVEECRGQQKLLKVVGEGYSSMPTGDDDVQFSLLVEYEGQQALNFDDHTATHRNIDRSLVCDNNQFPNTHKAQFGCEILYDGKTMEQIKRENEARFGTDGKIQYTSELLAKYHEYLNNNFRYATVEDMAHEEAIAEPIAKEMIESNHFVQNAMRNE